MIFDTFRMFAEDSYNAELTLPPQNVLPRKPLKNSRIRNWRWQCGVRERIVHATDDLGPSGGVSTLLEEDAAGEVSR